MINHHVVRSDITVHDTLAMGEVQSSQKLVGVISNVHVIETRIQRSEICIVYVFENDADVGSLYLISLTPIQDWGLKGYANLLTLDGIDELDDVGAIFEILEYLEFATDPISAILLE